MDVYWIEDVKLYATAKNQVELSSQRDERACGKI